jgi:site-specific DNA recombinase
MKAAIWWRVSTEAQKEPSPDTQIHECIALASQEGYEVPQEYIISTDWHSLSVWDNPPMDKLKMLIRTRSIQVIYTYHSDRLSSKPAHRLLFRAFCEEYGVIVRCKYGQIPEGDFGELMEFIDAWGKEKQVNRAKLGAADGIRDRARLNGLPTTNNAPYGYKWDFHPSDSDCLVELQPATTYPVLCKIWDMAKEGYTIRKISHALVEDGIPASRSGKAWHPATIHHILTNPVYAGKYYALRSRKVNQ